MDTARIAVTGAHGLLGATLMRILPGAVALAADIRDVRAVQDEMAALGDISYVVHTAAKTDVGACEKDPEGAHAVNAEGTKHIVEAARASRARVLYISTASVFSGERGNYRENDMPQPDNAYNKSKVRGEEYVGSYEGGTIIRLNLIGVHPDGSRGKNFMEWLVDSLGAGKDINAFADVMINPLSNWTIAERIQKLIGQGISERILHITSSDVRSKADIAEMTAARFPEYHGKITRTSVDSIGDGVRRPREMWLNCEASQRSLGITMPTVEEEIERIFQEAPLAVSLQ